MAKKKAAKKQEASESGGVNKSAAIRDYKTANPDAGPKAIVEALAAQGITVSAAQVSTTLSMAKKKMGVTPGKRGRKPSAASSSSGNSGGKGIGTQRPLLRDVQHAAAERLVRECASGEVLARRVGPVLQLRV